MYRLGNRARRGFGLVEVLVALGVAAVFLVLVCTLQASGRRESRITEATRRLRQIGVALDLYLQEHGAYPPDSSGLAVALAPYVHDPEVFEDPLGDEDVPGETVSALYRPLPLSRLDRPHIYITAMLSWDGATAVILRSGGGIDRLGGLALGPDADRADVLACLAGPEYIDGADGGGSDDGGDDDGDDDDDADDDDDDDDDDDGEDYGRDEDDDTAEEDDGDDDYDNDDDRDEDRRPRWRRDWRDWWGRRRRRRR